MEANVLSRVPAASPMIETGIRIDMFGIRVMIVLSLLLTTACERSYDQSSAQATVNSTLAMVKNGDVRRIHELIHADDERLQLTLARVGDILHRFQKLSETIREEFPDEVESFRARLEAAAIEKAEEIGRSRGEVEWGDNVQEFLLDPFEGLREQLARVEVAYVSDDMYALTIDGKPAFGVGVLLVQDEKGRWCYQWPRNIPGSNEWMPRTDAEWDIINNLLYSIANAVGWAEESIERGEVDSLNQVWTEAAEKVLPQVAATWFIYEQAIRMRPDESPAEPDSSGEG